MKSDKPGLISKLIQKGMQEIGKEPSKFRVFDELIKQVKVVNDRQPLVYNLEYLQRFDRINKAFADVAIRDKSHADNIVKVFLEIIPRLGIKHIEDALNEPYAKVIKNAILNPALVMGAHELVKGLKGKEYARALEEVRGILNQAYKGRSFAKNPLTTADIKKDFEAILSDGKSGLDPKVLAFMKQNRNAHKWVQLSEKDRAEVIRMLPLAGQRCGSDTKMNYFGNILNNLDAAREFYFQNAASYKGDAFVENTQKYFDMFRGIERDVDQVIAKDLAKGEGRSGYSDPRLANVVEIFKLNKSISDSKNKGASYRFTAFRSLLRHYEMRQGYTPEIRRQIASLLYECQKAHQFGAPVIEKLLKANVRGATLSEFIEMSEGLIKLLDKSLPESTDRNQADEYIDLILKLVSKKTVMGREVTKHTMNSFLRSDHAREFLDAYSTSPLIGDVLFSEVLKVKGLDAPEKCALFNSLYSVIFNSISKENRSSDKVQMQLRKAIVIAFSKSDIKNFEQVKAYLIAEVNAINQKASKNSPKYAEDLSAETRNQASQQINAMKNNPTVGEIVLEEVAKVKGLNPVQNYSLFNILFNNVSLSTLVKDDLTDKEKSELRGKIIKVLKKANLKDKKDVAAKMKMSQRETPVEYAKAMAHENAAKFISKKDKEFVDKRFVEKLVKSSSTPTR